MELGSTASRFESVSRKACASDCMVIRLDVSEPSSSAGSGPVPSDSILPFWSITMTLTPCSAAKRMVSSSVTSELFDPPGKSDCADAGCAHSVIKNANSSVRVRIMNETCLQSVFSNAMPTAGPWQTRRVENWPHKACDHNNLCAVAKTAQVRHIIG